MPDLELRSAHFDRPEQHSELLARQRRRRRVVSLLAAGFPLPRTRIFDLLRLLTEPVLDLRGVATLLDSEPLLQTHLMGLSASASLCPAEPPRSAAEMAVLLGSERLRALAWGCALADFASRRLPQTTMRSFWQHSILTALLAEKIAAAARPEIPECDYLAGLLHDLGRLPLLVALREERACGQSAFFSAHDQPAAERRYFGLDHAELGRWIALSANLPGWLRDVLAHHHEPARASEDPALVAVVAAADRASQPYSGEFLPVRVSPPEPLAAAELLDCRRPPRLSEQQRAAESRFLRQSLAAAGLPLGSC